MPANVRGIGCSTSTPITKPPRMTAKGKAAFNHYDIEPDDLAMLWQEHRATMPARLGDGEVHQTQLRAAMKSGKHHVVLVVSSVCRKGRMRHMFHAPGEDSRL